MSKGGKGKDPWRSIAPLLTRIPKFMPKFGKVPKFGRKHKRRKGN